MKRPISVLLLTLLTAVGVSGQEYFYVRDRDMFSFVRQGPGIDFPVTDTLYMMQIVRGDETEGGWTRVSTGGQEPGWVHRSRLRKMPHGTGESLGEIFGMYKRVAAFVMSADAPYIVLSFSGFYYPCRINAFFKEDGLKIRPHASQAEVWDLRDSGSMIWEWHSLIRYDSIDVRTDRLVVYNEIASYFITRKKGGLYLSVTPSVPFEPVEYPAVEIQSALEAAERFAALYDKGRSAPFNYNKEADNRLMHLLRSAYLRGDGRARVLYPLVLGTMITDGSGWQERLEYVYELWVHRHQGLVTLDEAAAVDFSNSRESTR